MPARSSLTALILITLTRLLLDATAAVLFALVCARDVSGHILRVKGESKHL